MRRSFDERLACHATTTPATQSPPEESEGKRRIVSGPPLFEENEECSKFAANIGGKEEKVTKVSNWSFEFKDNEEITASNTTGMANSVFRLPKTDLKAFDGDRKNWQDFIAIFRDLVHNNPGLSTTQKWVSFHAVWHKKYETDWVTP